MDLITYALLIKKIKAAGTGIADIKKEGGYIVFVMQDGTEFPIEDSTKDIIAVEIDEDNYIVVTYEDGTKTKSDKPIPYPDVMTGATTSKAGTSGLVPAPSKGNVRYLNSHGQWDSTVGTRLGNLEDTVALLSSTVPTAGIPNNATLTEGGWVVADEQEIADEFEQWED